jgi:Protein of unknown function (DUF1292).
MTEEEGAEMAEHKPNGCGPDCDHDHEHDHDMMESIVVMSDDEGNEKYFREEVIFPVGEDTFAVLVELQIDSEGEEVVSEAESDIFMAKVVEDENGEEVYTDPTDEEFEAALTAYEELFSEEDEDEAE